MNKKVLVDLFKEQDTAKLEVITTEQFFSIVEGIAAPLDSDNKVKLLAIYDKKGEGKINYTDFITEQKFVHAVRLKFFCMCTCYFRACMCVCVREREGGGREGEGQWESHICVFDDLFLM